MVTLFNFGHPITGEHVEQLARLLETSVNRIEVVDIPVQIDMTLPTEEEIDRIIRAASPAMHAATTGNNGKVIINLPGLSIVAAFIAVVFVKYFNNPHVLVLRRVDGTTPPRFEVKEVIPLR